MSPESKYLQYTLVVVTLIYSALYMTSTYIHYSPTAINIGIIITGIYLGVHILITIIYVVNKWDLRIFLIGLMSILIPAVIIIFKPGDTYRNLEVLKAQRVGSGSILDGTGYSYTFYERMDFTYHSYGWNMLVNKSYAAYHGTYKIKGDTIFLTYDASSTIPNSYLVMKDRYRFLYDAYGTGYRIKLNNLHRRLKDIVKMMTPPEVKKKD